MRWQVTYEMSNAVFPWIRELNPDSRERTVEYPTWHIAVRSAANIVAMRWTIEKPRIRAVR